MIRSRFSFRRWRRYALFALLLLAGATWVSVSPLWAASPLGRRSPAVTVTVPDLRGVTFTDGSTVDGELFELTVTYVYHPSAPPRRILSQDPSPGARRKITPGEAPCRLSVVVSLGEHLLRVPSVAGMSAREAADTLQAIGLQVTEKAVVTDPYTPDAPSPGSALGTSLPPDSSVPEGTAVTLYVAAPPHPASVLCPDVVGMTRREAVRALLEAGLRVEDIHADSTLPAPTDPWGIRRQDPM